MGVFYIAAAAFFFFFKSMLFFKIKTFILLKIKSLNYIPLFAYTIIQLKEIFDFFYVFHLLSILAYIYFFYSIFSLVFNLLKFSDYKEEVLSFQLNEFILKRHLLCLIKSSDFFTLILILIFIIFKIKILVKILFFKYIGLFCCLPILYAQWVLYKKIIYKYCMLIEMFVFTFNVNTLDMYIKKEYLEFKRLTYPVFFIVILECFSLILLNKNNFFLIDDLFIFINSFFYF